MNNLLNRSKQLILVKDMSNVIDFDNVRVQFDKLCFTYNVKNAISTDMGFFNKEHLAETKNALECECEQFLINAYGIREFTNLKMTESWGNVTHFNEWHHEHKHPFSVVSGVLFLDNNPENFNLHLECFVEQIPYFMEQRNLFLPISALIEDNGIDIKSANNLKNHLVLFLSNTAHFVNQVHGVENRRTIAFNTFWSGMTGIPNEPLASINF